MSAPVITKSGRKVTPPQVYSDAELSDDSQYASLSQFETTEDEQEIASHLAINNGGRNCNNNNYKGTNKTFTERLHRNGGFRSISTSSSMDDKQHIQRKPTRRPNPQIFNRNALMARENRIKKKQHLEELEHDVDALKQENHSLRKLLKKRSSMVCKLRDERLYLKSIIANKTSIMSLLKTIQGNRIPITSSAMSFVTAHEDQPTTQTDPSGYLNDEAYDLHYESNTNISQSPTHSLSSDCSSASSTSVCTEMPLDSWESLLPHDFQSDSFFIPQLSDVDDAEDQPENNVPVLAVTESSPSTIDCQSNVSHEHNYSNNHIIKQTVQSTTPERHSLSGKTGPSHDKRSQTMGIANSMAVDQPGICLHLSNGRVSLEFCGSCHRNSMDAWDEEEL